MLNNFAKGFDSEDADDDENDKGTSRAAGLVPFLRSSQSAVEEFGSGAVRADSIAPAEQVVNFVGDESATAICTHALAQLLN